MAKKETGVATVASEETLMALRQEFPSDAGFTRALLPRLGMYSQDQIEGKGKLQKVTVEAGTFYTDKETDEVDAEKKKIWAKEELGTEIELTIIFQRKQLRYYDESTEEYTSSPIYDNDTEIVPLFLNKKEIARDTPVNLKKKYAYTDDDGKKKSRLQDNRVLYALYEGELYQMSLHGSSMYSFMAFQRKHLVPAILVSITSEAMEKGKIAWNKMIFDKVRDLSQSEAENVLATVKEIKEGIAAEKAYFANQDAGSEEEEEEAGSGKPGKARTINDF